MRNQTIIKTTRTIYPQIYAYVTPDYPPNDGWIKIGYTERENVDDRVREQTRTACLAYNILWYASAKFSGNNDWFTDRELHAFLQKFKNIQKRKKSEWFYYDGTPKLALNHFNDFRNKNFDQGALEYEYHPRPEQEEAVKKTLEYAKNTLNGEFLWNAKPRFGKTLATYDFIQKMNAEKVLILTNRPAIANSWFDDFQHFVAAKGKYKFVSTADSLKNRPVLTREEFTNIRNEDNELFGCLAFISLQDLKGAEVFGGSHKKLEWVKDMHWDIIVIDEAHEGADTIKALLAFQNINRNFTLHLSGTPFKKLASGDFSNEQIYNWTYADEQSAKEAWESDAEGDNPYQDLPRLNLFSYRMSPMITDQVNQGADINGETYDFAFDLNEFFATKENGQFIHETEVKKWLDTLTKNEKYPFSTPELRDELRHTFWLLNRVASVKALAKLLKTHPTFENYHIIQAVGNGKQEDAPDGEISRKALDNVRNAVKEHDKTITLSVGQLTTGVTVPEWTAVLMLSNLGSTTLYMQAAFRAQNPWRFERNGEMQRKENAYIFDFAPERTLSIYDEFANDLDQKTAAGAGEPDWRENNLRKLLNFFPVIAEDDEGTMIPLDVRQILTIPSTNKAREVVRCGFRSNLLFQNITRIFTSKDALDIVNNLPSSPKGKTKQERTTTKIDTKNLQLDSEGNPVIPPEIVIGTTEANFGPKIYGNTTEEFTDAVKNEAQQLGMEHGLTKTQTGRMAKNVGQKYAKEVEIAKRQGEIDKKEAENQYRCELVEAKNDPKATQEAKERFDAKIEEIEKKTQGKKEKASAQSRLDLTEAILKTEKENEKKIVEDGIRSRLRRFASTIPSFLMAFGTDETTLANFDQTIDDTIFKETTGITLDQFRALRDTYNFFDQAVFNESVREFLRKREKLANYFDETQAEDIFDYIPNQRNNQIFTPRPVVRLMLDALEEENPDLFTDPARTFADLYVKSGLYLTEIVKRLMKGLETAIPDRDARLKHILEKQIYGFAPTGIIYAIAKRFIYGNLTDVNIANLQCRDLTESAKMGEKLDMKFDVVVGNPPYQKDGEARDEPIYHHFYNLAEKVSQKYCLISPARFLFNAGQTPKAWNAKILADEHLKVVYFEQNSENTFHNTDIKGGVAVLYRDESKILGPIGHFSDFEELRTIMKKVANHPDYEEGAFAELISSQGLYRFSEKFFNENSRAYEVQGKGTGAKITSNTFENMPEAFLVDKPQDDKEYIQLYGRVNSQRVYRYIRRDYVLPNEYLDTYNVFVPEANGTGAIGEVLSTPIIGTPIIGTPIIGATDTFISIGCFDNLTEAENCLKYVKSKFARTMLGILKVTQHNPKNTWLYVPLQDFSSSSDIDWGVSIGEIDRQLYAKYALSPTEITFIEEKVRPME